VKAVLGGGRCRARSLFQRPHPRNQRQHAIAVGLVGVAVRRDGGFNNGHESPNNFLSSFRDAPKAQISDAQLRIGESRSRWYQIPGSR
jgi:hypothetical protein